ncbi:AAA family ATPase [Rothia sp. 88186D007BW]
MTLTRHQRTCPLLTSQQVVATESKLFDYTSALVARETSYELSYSPLAKPLKLGAHQSVDERVLTWLFSSRVLTDVQGKRLSMPTDPAHRQALSDMAGTHQLVVVTGPAGAGKTTLLKDSKAAVEARGGRQLIVAPSAKAAEVAQAETGAQTNTAHGLLKAFGYDFSTDEHGVTTWSEPAENHYVPRAWALRPGDQLVVDEAGMLSQDVAVCLYEVALKTGAQLVVTGDYAQLSAVGRGGVLQQCAQISPVTTDLESVWRFRTATGEVDEAYAQLSLKMRARHNARAIFDELVDRGAVVLHADEASAQHALSQQWLTNQQAGRSTVVSASTNELVAGVNAEVALLRGVSGGYCLCPGY